MNKNMLISKIKSYQPILMPETPRSAAVLVILLEGAEAQLKMVLTKRSSSLTYAGDYSFPGGMKDDSDLDLKAAAIRETQEELNLIPDHYEMMGQLDDFYDRYGNVVRPFVAMMTELDFKKYYKISDSEIADIYYFSLDELPHIKEATQLLHITRRKPSYIYTYDNITIWGLTAGIMVHLGNIIYGLKRPLGKNIQRKIT